MTGNESSFSNQRVAAVIAEYFEAIERGDSPDRKTIMEKHPDIAKELESFFGNEAHFRQFSAGAVSDSIAVKPQMGGLEEQPAFDPNEPTLRIQIQDISLAEQSEVPVSIGRYRVEKLLGQGGFGIVYLGYDEKLSRPVAIKVPHRKLISKPEDAEVYLTEARTVANLDHPHIVPVYDVGSTNDFPVFVVSKYVEGRDLATKLKQSRLSMHEAVGLVATGAEALHYAHMQGLVHRDIKPGNILLDKSGKAFVVDFGLALREKDTGKGPRYAGTPAYMSPEQARGEGHRVDGRSDIFSLGVVFYELLTGRRPFKADSQAELLEQITGVEARPPRQVDDAIPKELERICLKSLSKRASERYTTAKDLAEDLRHFLVELPSPLTVAFSSPSNTPVAQPPSNVGGSGKSATPTTPISNSQPVRIVPKGLRSFDAHDSAFFFELLPGPRDRDGLPDSIRFWKTRIEETDADNTFSVGLIYGPSGCGKSSLVKAGLIPRLSDDVIPIYIEATAGETEARLLNGLRKRCPVLPDTLSLKESLATLRRGSGLPMGKKVVIFLDQFEQWLHAKSEEAKSELVQALRQCDGGRVQCIVMVRDDFWMAATSLMRDLEFRLLEGENSSAVCLFDLDHAKKVLAAFGRAFGRLPENPGETSKDEKEFLNKVVSGLTTGGKVICVRLALFAEMMKGRAWTPKTLKEVGGTDGVGVTFLEETFSATTAPPEHRYHQKAARANLKALLPETGSDIKGHMRSYAELLESSGYGNRPKDFDDLLRILDNEIRLITPTDPEGSEDSSNSISKVTGKYYQLTHDYLVHSLREWLTQKQKETRRGRAELLLADRAGVWNARPENRQLPSLLQWSQIQCLTHKKNWTQPQRKMMGRAGKYHAVRIAVFFLLMSVATATGLKVRENVNQREKANYARALVGRVFDADITQVPAIINEMDEYRAWSDSLLKVEKDKKADNPRKQLHASLALLPVDAGQVGYLSERLLNAEPQELVVIREALLARKTSLAEPLWTLLQNSKCDQDQRFRAACALSEFAPDDPRWQRFSKEISAMLVMQKPFLIPQWTYALKEAGRWLLPPLAEILVDENRSVSDRGLIATVYGKFAADVPDAYALLEQQLTQTAGPDATVEAKVALAKQQVSIGLALMLLGQEEKVWPLLKHSPDPTLRSFLIDRMAPSGIDPKVLFFRLDDEQEVSVIRAILLSLGEYGIERLSLAERQNHVPKLLALYRDHPDAGVHGAVELLLRKWEASDKLNEIDKVLATGKIEGQRRWYLNRQGQTMVVVPSGKFFMGEGNERHEVQIDRSFAMSTKEVTVDQFFLRFRKENQSMKEHSPRGEPVTLVQWYGAVAYCNWLIEQEGITKDHWCYEPNMDGKYEAGMTMPLDFLQRTGYRLPTEAEWEYACRAGSDTGYSFGDSEELLGRYCWFSSNSFTKSHPVGLLKPNDLGLFDMHGNMFEWCQDFWMANTYQKEKLTPTDRDSRVLRGGSFGGWSKIMGSAYSFKSPPMHSADGYGCRLARTLPSILNTPLPPTIENDDK